MLEMGTQGGWVGVANAGDGGAASPPSWHLPSLASSCLQFVFCNWAQDRYPQLLLNPSPHTQLSAVLGLLL